MNPVALHLELALGHSHEDDQRRVQAQRLFQHVFQLRNLAQRMETHRSAVAVQLVEFVDHGRVGVAMAHQLDQRPRSRTRAGVMAGEHHRDEHAGDLVGREPGSAGLSLDGDEHVEHVTVALVGGWVGDPAVHDVRNQCHQTIAGFVAATEALDRQIRVDVG